MGMALVSLCTAVVFLAGCGQSDDPSSADEGDEDNSEAEVKSHQAYADALIQLMERIRANLESAKDAESAKTAAAELKEMTAEMPPWA